MTLIFEALCVGSSADQYLCLNPKFHESFADPTFQKPEDHFRKPRIQFRDVHGSLRPSSIIQVILISQSLFVLIKHAPPSTGDGGEAVRHGLAAVHVGVAHTQDVLEVLRLELERHRGYPFLSR